MKETFLAIAVTAALAFQLAAAAPRKGPLANPDFTKGEAIPDGATHDWNLGATGMRGWMYCDKMVTTDARQIAVTQVDKGSPADGVLLKGDVILGVGGKPFAYDPRTEFGKALTVAESTAGGGKLSVTRWREGKSEEVVVKLPVLGTYSATAPFACAKSKAILEKGCKALAARIETSANRDHPIVRSVNALALLASGDPAYLPVVKKEAQWAASYTADSRQTWQHGYVTMLVAEYMMATGDQSLMPGLQRLALEAAKGQSAVGSWGHGFARPDGRLGGYGMMNSPGLPLTISLVMAREAGVKDPAVANAIDLSTKLMRFYIGKGAVPYGDHAPWIESHDDNGKCGMAAVLFNLLGEAKGADFFGRMSVASHGPERDTGHTGNFFNVLWAMPGVAQSGPQATGAWMSEFGAWYYDLGRRWDGICVHQGPPEPNPDAYGGWDCTGTYLLAYAMPLKKIFLTGKRPALAAPITAAAAQALVNDGRGWSNKDRNSAYDKMTIEQLVERLGSWSPVVRERAAMAFGRRKDAPIEPVLKLLESSKLEARYGACQALTALRGRGAPAVDALCKALADKDLWLRVKAADALTGIGAPAGKAVPQLLELLAQPIDAVNDPRGMQQRFLCFALFSGHDNLLSREIAKVNHETLYKAVRASLKNQDGRARGSVGSVYRSLTQDDIKVLLPAIYQAATEYSPSGEMFADEIRVEGFKLLAKNRVEEGIDALVKYVRDQNPWASEKRTPELIQILLTYGNRAKPALPELVKVAETFEKGEKDFPKSLSLQKAKAVRDAIQSIETSTEAPQLIRMK